MSATNHGITTAETFVQGPRGRLFVRNWSPATPATKAPIVMFHDSLGSVDLWRNFPAALAVATGRQVIAYDRLGFGRSDVNGESLRRDFVATEAETGFAPLRQHLGIGRFVLFGHSVGGGMAANVAAKNGADCVAVVTEAAQTFVEDKTLAGIRDARELFRDPAQVDRLKRYHGEKTQWVLDAWINTWLKPEFGDWSLEPVLPQVKCPLLVIHGAEDEYGSPRHPQDFATFAGGRTQVELMPDTRHVPHREKEAVVVGMVTTFLQSLD